MSLPLSKEILASLLAPLDLTIDVFETIDSTNTYLKTIKAPMRPMLCCAEQQTQGRGRFSRPWSSPYGNNIYLSLRLTLGIDISQLSGFSLVVCLALLKALKLDDLAIKWPNDLVFQGDKCAGILIEIIKTRAKETDLVIGIGLNVNEAFSAEKPWTSLYQITGQVYDRNQLIAVIATTLFYEIDQFSRLGFNPFMAFFKARDYLLNKEITVTQPEAQYKGICRGINALGHLCLEEANGLRHFLSAGNTSLSGGFVLS